MLFPGAWAQNDRVRRFGWSNLLEAAIAGGAERFIQESFALTYPDRGAQWIDETTRIEPARYNRTVADAERAAERFARRGRIGVVLRFAGFYGADAEHVQAMIPWIRRGWALIPGAPDGFVSSVSHRDAATAVVAALSVPPGAYNVVDDKPLRRREYFEALAAAIDVAPPRLPPRGWHICSGRWARQWRVRFASRAASFEPSPAGRRSTRAYAKVGTTSLPS
jgi:nucleoside-diphosphate-sugar epimerase